MSDKQSVFGKFPLFKNERKPFFLDLVHLDREVVAPRHHNLFSLNKVIFPPANKKLEYNLFHAK